MVIIAEESESIIHDVEKQQSTTDHDLSPTDSKSNQTGEEEQGANVSGDHGDLDAAADGFETASEREVSDCDSDDDRNVSNSEDLEKDSRLEAADTLQLGLQLGLELNCSWDEAMTECHNLVLEENRQSIAKALAEANDAKVLGNKMFAEGKFEEALSQYEHALQVAPDMSESTEIRSICHSNRGVCFLKLGKYEDTIKECTKALELNPTYIKALVRRGEAHEKLEHFEEAIADMKKILELDASNEQAKKSIRRLEPLAAEKREKMKEEMIGKLKEMGNSLLGRFGMSVDNFKAVKDPNTGSYSVSFQK